jgi:acetyl-CoA acetyltransferase family protein
VNPRLAKEHYPYTMGDTAENVAQRYNVTREEQDAFAFESQRKYHRAAEKGRFRKELVPVFLPQPKGDAALFDTDEQPRVSTLEKLATLKPAFQPEGTVTAGNAAGINDGAAAALLVNDDALARYNLKPMVRIIASAVAGVDPAYMGMGPVPAIQKVLQRANLSLSDIDLFEVNEAFASQSVAVVRELGIDMEKLNVNGGSIAMGHPLGSSGARITATLVHEMRRREGVRYGLIAMCVGVGQGVAMVVEKV